MTGYLDTHDITMTSLDAVSKWLDSVVGVKAKKDNSQHLSALVPDPSLCLYPRYSASVLWMKVNEV